MTTQPSTPAPGARDGPVLIDLDGTLVDTLGDIVATTNHLRTSFDLPAVAPAVARSWVGDGVVALMERALADAGPFEPLRQRAREIYFAHHWEACVVTAAPYPGAVAALAGWRAAERPLAVVTNKPRRFSERILAHLELLPFFGALVCGDDLPEKKPSPAPLHEALRRLGARPGLGVMVGDSIQDLRAARAAGLRSVAALYGFSDPAILRREGADEFWAAFAVREESPG
ncbi:MAG: HAD-IA family hydrolase [Planctomycetota bacterium]